MTVQLHPGPHPDADSLSAFLEGVLPEHERLECLAHFAACSQCREAIFLARAEVPAVEEPSWIPVWQRWLKPVPVLSGALAASALAVVMILYLFHGPSAPHLHEIARVKVIPQAPIPQATSKREPAQVASSFTAEAGLVARHRVIRQPSVAPQPPASGTANQVSTAAKPLTVAEAVPPPPPPVPTSGAPEGERKGFRNLSTGAEVAATAPGTSASVPPALSIQHDESSENGLSTLTGAVTDMTGAVVPGATVTLRQPDGKTVASLVTDAAGHFALSALPLANYTLTVTAPGFTTWEERNITLVEEARLTVPNIVLQVGTVAESVAVVAASDAVVSTDTGESSTTLNQEVTKAPPLAGRDASELVKIMPGAAAPTGRSSPPVTTVTMDKRILRVSSAGLLLFSGNAGKNWKTIKPLWAGKVIGLAIVDGKVFQLTTETGSVWLSSKGTHWKQAPARR
jgi:hypothetical protein